MSMIAPTVPAVTLDEDLAKQLARAADRLNRDQTLRDRLIIEAFIQGASLRDIGEAAGMSHVGVKKLVERADYLLVAPDGTVLSIIEAKALSPEEKRAYNVELNKGRRPTPPRTERVEPKP